ncbi:hypothetical protein V8B55DRAFT_1584525 [Mucor lusitanicus]|uniref:RBR-type E3 ubiquitin transferase n=1 Tax=Mucor circinelloides f. lusitanicus TaxID=29924 RepID=A0A8H4BH53_MUCCL|nr:hypothetical protein FB192DRAFT_1325910 [Mucor lusitanicus]
MYESEDSSVASSSFGEQDEMEQFMNRCSICFDAHLDFCLEYCRDQYCLDCFQKYIVQVVQSSWGLSVTPIRCPVCTEQIPKHEWTQYVPRKIIDMYEKYNKPYRSYTRACPHCQDEMTPCVYNANRNQLMQPNSSRLFCDIMESMLFSCYHGESHKNHADHIAVKRWITIYKRQDWSDTSKLLTLYKSIMQDVLTFEKHHIKQTTKRFAHNISHEFINNFCVKPDVWKSLQFAHISNFPQMSCTSCHAVVCLHCGYDAHPDADCEQNMRWMVKDKATAQEVKETVKWTLANSRRCPNCSIMINRDEGCNKVDCSYCGFCFCWACRSSWADGCGFYRCANVSNQVPLLTATTATTTATTNNEDKTELGVPNMKNIQARLVNHHFQRQEDRMEID